MTALNQTSFTHFSEYDRQLIKSIMENLELLNSKLSAQTEAEKQLLNIASEKIYTVEEAAKVLNVEKNTVNRYRTEGHFTGVKLKSYQKIKGGKVDIKGSDLTTFMIAIRSKT